MTIVKTAVIALLLAGAGVAAAEPATPKAPADEAVAAAEVRSVRLKACEPPTGSRIRSSSAVACRSGSQPTRIYTQEELLRTGAIGLIQALGKLDPAFL